MQRSLKIIFVCSVFIFLTGSGLISDNLRAAEEGMEEVSPHDSTSLNLIIRFRDRPLSQVRSDFLKGMGVSRRSIPERSLKPRSKAADQSEFPNLTVVGFSNERELESARVALTKDPNVLYAEPDYKLRIQLGTKGRIPNDFNFLLQTGLLNEGSHGTKAGADIGASLAWRTATGSRDVVVAIIDTGIDCNHPDLAANIWTNPREIPGNGIDDDGNGFVDDVHGFDFAGRDGDPFDDNKHGTHVSGIVGASGNNGLGISGVCWNVSLMGLKAFGSDGTANLSDVLDAIAYAIGNGANIINASWGLDTRSKSLEEAVIAAQKAGVLFIAAAGNDRSENPFYPAGYSGVISVAATDSLDQRAIFSNFGTNITIAAPGQDIYSTVPNGGYEFLSGTSMASPHVAGLAALILADHPDFSAQSIRDIIVNSADAIQTDHPLGRGRINAGSAIKNRISLPKLSLEIPATIYGTIDINGSASGVQFDHYSLWIATGNGGTNFAMIAQRNEPVNSGVLASNFNSYAYPDGPCVFKLEAQNTMGGKATIFANALLANTAITDPSNNDVLRSGQLVEIHGRIPPGMEGFQLEYAPGFNPSIWTNAGIRIGTREELAAGLLARWDTSLVAPNEFYSLRLIAGNGASSGNASFIYLDQHLKAGWPKRIPANANFPIADWRNVVAADLDGDGRKEIILVEPGSDEAPSRLLVFNATAELMWSRDLAAGFPNYDIPTVGDLDGDGLPEVIVDVAGSLYVFHGNGEPFPGWPITLESPNQAKVVADLKQNGEKEIIAYSQEPISKFGTDWRVLTVFDKSGNVMRAWNIPFCAGTNDAPKLFPAIANLDDDSELEIVVQSGCNSISAYKLSSARNPIWTAYPPGKIVASPVVGDLDHDGTNDVIVATTPDDNGQGGGLYCFNAQGHLRRGWPVLVGESLIATPALGDLDGDGLLEISFPSASRRMLHLIQSDGFEADGWPVPIGNTSSSGSSVLGDVDGDKAPDVVIALPGFIGLAISNNDPTFIGGVKAWNFHGAPIPLNGPGKNTSLPLEASGATAWNKSAALILTDVDNDGLLDIIGTSIQERSYATPKRSAYLKNRSGIYIWNLGVGYRSETAPWPQFQQDTGHQGLAPLASIKPDFIKLLRQRLIVYQDKPLIFSPLVNDSFQLKGFTQPTNGIVRTDDQNQFVYQAAAGYHGIDGFNYELTDGITNETIQVSILVKARYHVPLLTNQTVSLAKNSSKAIFFDPGDPNRDPLTYQISKPADHGVLWVSPGVATYFPKNGYFGTDSFTYTASDGTGTSDPALVRVTVLETNNPPNAVDDALRVRAGKWADFQLHASDIDGDPLIFSIVAPPAHGLLEGGPVQWTYRPAPAFVGLDRVQFVVSDGAALSKTAEIVITVTEVNTAPTALPQTVSTAPGSAVAIRLSGFDPENEELTFRIRDLPLHGSISVEGEMATYIPAQGYSGPDRFTFSARDSDLESESASVEVSVRRPNRVPMAESQRFFGITNQPVPIELKVMDPDRDPVTSVILDGPKNGRIWGSGTHFVYLPNVNFGGTDSFSFRAWDGFGYGDPTTVAIDITPVPPLSLPYFNAIELLENGAIELTILQRPDQSITIESSADTYVWQLLTRTQPGTNLVRIFDTNHFDSNRFYRATSVP